MNTTKTPDEVLAELVGKTMWTCRRAAEMATFQFGRRTQVRDYHGGSGEVGEWSLHVQCEWRVVRDNAVTVGSGDLNYPAHYRGGESVSANFDWDRDPNLRDTRLNTLFEGGNRGYVVRRTELRSGGACQIEFDEGMCLELFPSVSFASEHWRLFATGDDERQVLVTGGVSDLR